MDNKRLAAGGFAALILATPAFAQQSGTVEIGAFAQYTWFDERFNLNNQFGGGARLGVFLSPRVALEGDIGYASISPSTDVYEQDAAPTPCTDECSYKYIPLYFRVAYNQPLGQRAQLVVGPHIVRSDYEFTYEIGYGALLGLRANLSPRVAFRVDGLVDWHNTPNIDDDSDLNYTLRAGLSVMLRNDPPIEQMPAPIVVEEPPPAPAPVRPAVNQDSINRVRDSISAAERRIAEARNTLQQVVYFDYDQSEIRGDAQAALNDKVPVMQASPGVRIRIEGHADERGSDEYNMALGQRRAAATKRYLVQQGIAEARIDIVSFGEERPACTTDDESCHERNRRGEFVIVAGGEGMSAPD